MKIDSYTIGTGAQLSRGIWLSAGTELLPVIYFRKPKHLSEETFDAICACVALVGLPNDFEIKEADNERD